MAYFLSGSLQFTNFDLLVLVDEVLSLEVHSRQYSLQKVDEYVGEGFEVISSTLLIASVYVAACVSCCSRQKFSFLELDMVVLGVSEFFRQPKINKNQVAGFFSLQGLHYEVVWLDIPVYDVPAVAEF